MSEQTVNIPLLRKAVEWAEAEALKPIERREWIQAEVVTPPARAQRLYGRAPECGTCYCIAGFVAQTVDASYSKSVWGDGGSHAIDFAAEALCLPMSGDAALNEGGLFSGGNTIEDVRRIAEEIAGERL